MNRRLLRAGLLLFLLGLLTGLVIPILRNPRMGLSAHLEGTLNGMFLVLVGAVWGQFALGAKARAAATWMLLYAAFANWTGVLLAAIWGTSRVTPIAGAGFEGAEWQELVVTGTLLSVAIVLISAVGMLIWGLRGHANPRAAEELDARPARASAGR